MGRFGALLGWPLAGVFEALGGRELVILPGAALGEFLALDRDGGSRMP